MLLLRSRRASLRLIFFFQAEDGIRDGRVTGVQTCALPIYRNETTRGGEGAAHHAAFAHPLLQLRHRLLHLHRLPLARMPRRCHWARGEPDIVYHDAEWGVPSHDDRGLFELLVLEGAQAGLSWSTILARRAGY